MNLSKMIKKATALLLTSAMLGGGVPSMGSLVLAEESDNFDQDNVVLRMGIVSDLHVGRGNADARKNYVQKYADSVLALDQFANNQLDALLLCGDYTEDGTESEATTFASASKAILDVINEDKEDSAKTKFVMTYGNHDTERGEKNMSYEQWETLLETYELLDGVTKGPDDSGSYKATIEKDGKTYTIFSVETDQYYNPGSNMFRKNVLQWLDEGLKTVTTSNPNSYVYVISHAPIQGTGVYGSDKNFYGNADWATAKPDKETDTLSSKIDEVLKDYPQVMYFSGHTHLTNSLESTIMSKDYTAVNVANLLVSDLIHKADYPCDNIDNATKDGFALYLEVDKDGNQRIQRIVKPYDSAECTITYSETVTGAENDVVVTSINKGTVTAPNTYGTAWKMNAPDESRSHLTKYSAETRKATPTFAEGASVTTSEAYVQDGKLMLDVEFDKATCTNTIIRYEISLISPNDKVCSTKWVLGNWTDCKSGVPEGETRSEAAKFKYTVTNLENAGDAKNYKICVTAVDEFGGRSDAITSDPISDVQQYLTEQSDRFVKDELFHITSTDQIGFTEPNYVNNKVTVDNGTMVFDGRTDISYYNSQTKTVSNKNTALGNNIGKHTDFAVDDTFVYEAEFTAEAAANGNNKPWVVFTTRIPDVTYASGEDDANTYDPNNPKDTVAVWKSDSCGVYLGTEGVRLYLLDGRTTALSDQFKIDVNDTESHTIKIISSPKFISVYIDGKTIYENQLYTLNGLSFESGWNPLYNNFLSMNADMVPALGVRLGDTKLTLKDQSLYYYYPEDEAKLHHAVDDIPGAEEFNITKEQAQNDKRVQAINKTILDFSESTNTDLNTTVTVPSSLNTTTVNFYTSSKKFQESFTKDSYVLNALGKHTDFTSQDTFVWEADFDLNPNDESSGPNAIFNFRMPNTTATESGIDVGNSDRTGVLIFRGQVRLNMLSKGTGGKNYDQGDVIGTYDREEFFNADHHHIKIISTPTHVTVYLDYKLVGTGAYPFTPDQFGFSNLKDVEMIPTLAFHVRQQGEFKIYNQSVYKLRDESITTYNKQDNLVYSENADLQCSVPGEGVAAIIGNSFYANMLATNQAAVNTGHQGWTNTLTLLKSGYQLDAKRSYVLSALGTVVEGGENRFTFNLGKYNGKDVWGFISGTKLSMFTEDGDQWSFYTLPEYSEGDTFRLTALLTPFGFNLYFNGKLGYTHTFEDSSLVSYAPKFGIGTNVKGAWRDIVLYENVDNGQQYKEALSAEAEKLTNTLGVYLSEEDKTHIDTVQSVCDALTGTQNEALVPYVGTLKYTKVYNNMVLEGLTSAKETAQYTVTGKNLQKTIPLFDGVACPITLNDTWAVDFDVVVNRVIQDANLRLGFLVKGTSMETSTADASKGMLMNNGNIMTIHKQETEKDNGLDYAAEPNYDNRTPISKVGIPYHFKFTVTPQEDELFKIEMTITGSDGKSFSNSGVFDLVDVIEPKLAIMNIDATISNLCVSYDLTEDISELETAKSSNSSKETTGMALRSVALYQAACQVAEDLIVTKKKVNDFYTRDEIRKATSDLSATLLMYGDITKDDVRDARDIVRLIKQVANENVEMDILVSDVDNSGGDQPDDKDVIALREALVQ